MGTIPTPLPQIGNNLANLVPGYDQANSNMIHLFGSLWQRGWVVAFVALVTFIVGAVLIYFRNQDPDRRCIPFSIPPSYCLSMPLWYPLLNFPLPGAKSAAFQMVLGASGAPSDVPEAILAIGIVMVAGGLTCKTYAFAETQIFGRIKGLFNAALGAIFGA